MKVLITGGAGRLGRSVAQGLSAVGWDIVSVDRVPAGVPGVRDVIADLTDVAATHDLVAREQPDALVHLAAIAVPFSAPEHEILVTNTTLAISVLGAAAAAGVPQVLAASSPTVIGYGNPQGWAPHRLPIDETHAAEPWNAYSLSKLVIEATMSSFARTATSAIWGAFRPCYVIAPEEWQGALTQQGHTVHDRLAEPGLASVSLFNYVDARDVAEFVRRWIEADDRALNGEVFFVGAEDALAVADVRTALAGIADADMLNDLTARSAIFSSAKAERLLGWHPRRTWRDELATASDFDQMRTS